MTCVCTIECEMGHLMTGELFWNGFLVFITAGDDQSKKKEGVLSQMFPIYIWPLDELLWTMHTMLPWGFPSMKTSSQYVETTK